VSVSPQTSPRSSCSGLGWVTRLTATVTTTSTTNAAAEQDPAERVWWRRPTVLGAIALALTALLYLVFVF
jgi:hypothetical protein